MTNEHKVITATENGYTVHYCDNNVVRKYPYEETIGLLSQKLKDLQLKPSTFKGKRYQPDNNLQLSKYQQLMLRDAMFGLTQYSPRQLRYMKRKEKMKIIDLHQKAQDLLKCWKLELFYGLVDDYLLHGIPGFEKLKGKLNLALRTQNGVTARVKDDDIPITFADLNVSRKDIAQFLINKGVLPEHYIQAAA